MGYCHMFYGLDLAKLQTIYGSRDKRLVEEILDAHEDDFDDNDDFFEDAIEEGSCPDSRTALREIVTGSLGDYEDAGAMYGYVLKIICEHIGKQIPYGVACVAEHGYASQLVASGPPIPLPQPEDFPEIGFISLSDIPKEIERIDTTPLPIESPRAPKSKSSGSSEEAMVAKLLAQSLARRRFDKKAIAEDRAEYRKVLTKALKKGVSIVSFRH